MATWDELNKNVGAKPVSISSSWDQANEQARQVAQENEKTRTEAVVQTPQEVAVESKGFVAKAMEAGKSVIKYGLDAVNFVNKTYEAGIDLAAQPLSRTRFIQEAAAGLDAMDRGEVEFNNKAYLGKSLLETLSNPAVATLNTKAGKSTVGFISENSSNLPLKTIAAFSAIGDKTYEEAYGAWLTERNDPANPAWQKFLYEVQDAVPQTLIGVALSLGTAAVTRNAGAGMAVSGAFYTALSADSQIQEKGEVTSLANLAIDVVGDQVLNRALLGLFGKGGSSNKIIAALGGMGIEGSTEVAQSLLKYANDYGNARTQAQKNEVLADAKNYVLNGGLLMEFGVGAVAGGLATVAVDSVLPTNTVPNRPTTRPNAEERKKMEERIDVAIDNQNINEMRDKFADYQLVFDPNDQQDVEIMGAMSETLNDYVATFNDKTLYVPSETTNAPLVEVETVRFPDGQFAARYSVNTESETIGSTFDFKNLHKSQKAASDAAIADLTTQITVKLETTVDEAVLAQLQDVLEYASGRKKVPVPTQEERVDGALGTDELVELQKNPEIYSLATEKDETKALSTIEAKVSELYGNLSDTDKAELAADVYDIIRDPKFSSIVADLSLKEIIEQAQRVGARFQTEDRVEADFEGASKAEMSDVARFIELVRTEKPVPKSLLTDIKDIAAKYGFRDGLSDTELARLFSLRIGRDERLSALQEAGLAEFDAEQATAAEQRKKRAEQAKKRNEKVNEGDVKRLLREIPLLQSVPIQKVRSITTPTGRKAFGRFYMNSIQYVEDADVTTLPHESFHAYSDMALTKAEQQEMYAEARRIYGRQYASDLDIEETLAQDFAVWFVNKKQKPQGFSERLMEMFNKIAEFFSKFLNKRNRKTLEDIFSDVITEGAAKRVRTTAQKRMTSGDMQAMRVEFFNDPEAFTLKMFSNDIFKKDLVGYIEVKQAIKAMNLKKGEAALHELVLDRPEYKDQKKFDSRQYINAVKSEMLQIRVVESDTYANYGMDNINLDYSPSLGEEPKTYILNTNFEHGRTGHFGRDNASGLHSHFRAVLMRDDSAFKVLEIQSDTYQRGLQPLTEESVLQSRDGALFSLRRLPNVFNQQAEYIETNSRFNINLGALHVALKEMADSELAIAIPAELEDLKIEDLEADTGKKVSLLKNLATQVDNAINSERERLLSQPLTEAEKLRIKQSEQFDSMKNLWYEQNIRMAIRKAAEKGAAFIDFADTRTVANIEGYVGGGGGQIYRETPMGDYEAPRDAVVGDEVTYLDNPAIVVETMHSNNTLGVIYNESGGLMDTMKEADLIAEERARLEDEPEEFASRFWYEIQQGFFNKDNYYTTLTEDELLTVLAQAIPSSSQEEALAEVKALSETELDEYLNKYQEKMWDIALNDSDPEITEKAEDFRQETIDKWESEFDGEEWMKEIYGENSVYSYSIRQNNLSEVFLAYDTEGGTIQYVEASYGNDSREEFDLSDMDESQAGIAAKYGVNEIGGKTKEGEYYKYIKKTRPDLELYEDDNGFTWWRSAITDADMADVPLYQQEEDDGTSRVYEELAEELERITYEIEVLLDIAGVVTIKNPDGSYRRESTYPKWIPKDLRDKKKLAKVFEKVLKGEPVRGSIEEQMYNLMEEYVLSELPPELAQEFVLEQYYNQQYEVADAARAEALSVLQTFVRNLDKKMKKSAKLRTKEVKKVIRTNTGQIRTDTKEFSREMRKRARFFNRGYKTGYKQGAKDKLYALLAKDRVKRDRKGKIETLKRYYKRVKQASRTGSTLPLDYQQRLKEIFEAFDLTTMTQKTKGSLSRTQAWFASQEGDVPKDIAKKLERLDKIPVGKLGDDALEQIINEVTRIFENGVTKKRLQDTRDEKEFAAVVERVANSTRDLSRETGRFSGAKKLSYKLFDPTRFADYMDGSAQNYSGANFKELVEPVRIAIDKANIRTDSITADVFAEIEQFGEQYSDEEMARMMYTMALEQGAEKQAEAMAEFYKNEKGYDFVMALTQKERGAVEAMRRAFKEIRPEVAGAFEQINNTPFPDIPNYFPLRYDREKELFQIKDQAFDFSITKTSQGFTINRQPSVGRILDINVFKTFANQMSSQIYYAEVQPALDRTRAIINSPLYQSKLNRETQDYWKQFVEDVATRGRGTGDFIGKDTMDALRGNISAAILGYKLSTVMIQPSAVFDSMTAIRQELGAKAVLEIIPRFLKMVFSPAALQAASERSVALKNRAGGTLEIQEMRNATRGIFSDSMWRRGWHSFKSNAYAGIRFTDMRTAASVFDTLVAGYEKKGLDRDAATKRAEQIMMLSQSSANVASRPQILNSASTRFFLPFQSFVINAFNNIRYDAITREFKRNGKIKATFLAISNMQFLAYAVAYEALMYSAISSAFGYDDDEDEQSFLRKMFNSAIGRIPAIGFIVAFDGTVSGKIAANNPVIEAFNANLTALVETAEGDLQAKEAYKAIKGMLTLLGIPATQQIHQILTAPDIAGLGSIGMNFGISYDARKNAEKQRDAVMPLFDNNASPELNQDTLAKLTEEVYGTDYTKADIDKKKEKEAALRRQFAIAQEFGFDDPFVNAVLEKTNNNEVKQAFIEQFNTFSNPNAALSRYGRPIRVMGEQEKLLSDELESELRAIATAPEQDRTRVLDLVAEDITDTERKLIIGDDKQFASLAYRRYGVISKEFYESIK